MTSRAEHRAGFTLIEMAVVLALMGLLLSLALTRGGPGMTSRQPHAAALEIAAALREARAQAIGSGRDVAFRLDLSANRYQFENRGSHPLPDGIALTLTGVARGMDEEHNAGSMFFAPDGSASGGRISVAAQGRRETVSVNWLNGLVTVSDAP